MVVSGANIDPELLAHFKAGTLTVEMAEAKAPRSRFECLILMVQLSVLIAEGGTNKSPHQPSSATPPYEKPESKKRSRQRGGKSGHPGNFRAYSPPNQFKNHRLECCPCCQGPLVNKNDRRTRLIEDIDTNLQPVVTEHTIERSYCERCRKTVEPIVDDAMPHATIGHQAVVASALMHFDMGNSISQVVQFFQTFWNFVVTPSGLCEIWRRLSEQLEDWYHSIIDEMQNDAVIHADETGWRVGGRLQWLWCASGIDSVYYTIEPSRGSDIVMWLIRDEFEGVLATDFWQAYNIVDQLKQKCWAHLLRELQQVEEDGKDRGDWADFAKKLRRIFADGVRLVARRHELTAEKYIDLTLRLQGRLIDLAVANYENADARRLAKRLDRERDALLTFVEKEGIEPTNNRAERDIRPAVIMRKISQGNKTDDGARAQARMMSIIRTLKKRGYDPLETITDALKTKVKTNVLPPLPKAKKP